MCTQRSARCEHSRRQHSSKLRFSNGRPEFKLLLPFAPFLCEINGALQMRTFTIFWGPTTRYSREFPTFPRKFSRLHCVPPGRTQRQRCMPRPQMGGRLPAMLCQGSCIRAAFELRLCCILCCICAVCVLYVCCICAVFVLYLCCTLHAHEAGLLYRCGAVWSCTWQLYRAVKCCICAVLVL